MFAGRAKYINGTFTNQTADQSIGHLKLFSYIPPVAGAAVWRTHTDRALLLIGMEFQSNSCDGGYALSFGVA